MNLRTYVAIHLGVPDSGLPWLDGMIWESLRTKLAGQAMQGLLAGMLASGEPLEAKESANMCIAYVGALLAEMDKKEQP